MTAENKNVFSFAAKVQTVQFNIPSPAPFASSVISPPMFHPFPSLHQLLASKDRWRCKLLSPVERVCRAADAAVLDGSGRCDARACSLLARQTWLGFVHVEMPPCNAHSDLRARSLHDTRRRHLHHILYNHSVLSTHTNSRPVLRHPTVLTVINTVLISHVLSFSPYFLPLTIIILSSRERKCVACYNK